MKYSFDEEVRKVFTRAQEEAVHLQHDYIGTEHMLLALADERDPLLGRVGLDPRLVRVRLQASVRRGRGAAQPSRGVLPYTSRMKKALEFSMAAAADVGDTYVGSKHLLIGLMRERKGIAAQVLVSLGLDEVTAIARLWGAAAARAVAQASGGSASEAPGESAFRMQIDDASSASIYEQIVARVQEGVATGELAPGDRLPTVRRLADDLDIAPGTVARAYGELERLGVVVTEGARGTRIAERKRARLANGERAETLIGLLRPVVVAAFHLGATAEDVRAALEPAMAGIYDAS